MTAYYNEIEPYAVEWLKNLIAAGLIAPGDVDDRDIRDVTPTDLAGYDQCHFFAGLGGWSLALRLAGWSDDRPVWTGSCPCQPFSQAGRGGGFADERHLWPYWFHHVSVCRPATVFGEQVASPDGLKWFDLVSADLEAAGYAVGSADLCAAGVGAPHLRQRLWFVGHSPGAKLAGWPGKPGNLREELPPPERTGGDALPLAHAPLIGGGPGLCDSGPAGFGRSEPANHGGSFWSDLEWLYCRDGRWRPTKPGLFPLAHGIPARVGRLRAAGNAIVSELAAEFIRACLETGVLI